MSKTTKTTKPTALNLWVLAKVFGDTDVISNRIEPTAVSHIRRCLAAGLVVVDGHQLRLTDAGLEAVLEQIEEA
jgi:hypothetical protein